MLKTFTGTHNHKMDDKGRVSLPTEFRRVLDEMQLPNSLYVIPKLEEPDSIAFLTTKGYDQLIERHNAAAYPTKREQKRAGMKFLSRTTQIQIDDAGRIVVARPLREKFELGKDVRFVGAGSYFELWQPEVHDAYEAALEALDLDEPFEIDTRGLHD